MYNACCTSLFFWACKLQVNFSISLRTQAFIHIKYTYNYDIQEVIYDLYIYYYGISSRSIYISVS